MSIQSLLARHSLINWAPGISKNTITHTRRIVGFFDTFMVGIPDVTKVETDDRRRFIPATQQQEKWAGALQMEERRPLLLFPHAEPCQAVIEILNNLALDRSKVLAV